MTYCHRRKVFALGISIWLSIFLPSGYSKTSPALNVNQEDKIPEISLEQAQQKALRNVKLTSAPKSPSESSSANGTTVRQTAKNGAFTFASGSVRIIKETSKDGTVRFYFEVKIAGTKVDRPYEIEARKDYRTDQLKPAWDQYNIDAEGKETADSGKTVGKIIYCKTVQNEMVSVTWYDPGEREVADESKITTDGLMRENVIIKVTTPPGTGFKGSEDPWVPKFQNETLEHYYKDADEKVMKLAKEEKNIYGRFKAMLGRSLVQSIRIHHNDVAGLVKKGACEYEFRRLKKTASGGGSNGESVRIILAGNQYLVTAQTLGGTRLLQQYLGVEAPVVDYDEKNDVDPVTGLVIRFKVKTSTGQVVGVFEFDDKGNLKRLA